MVQEGDVKQFCTFPNLCGNRYVSFTWLEVATRVIMGKDNLVCICLEGILEDYFLVNHGPTSPSFE